MALGYSIFGAFGSDARCSWTFTHLIESSGLTSRIQPVSAVAVRPWSPWIHQTRRRFTSSGFVSPSGVRMETRASPSPISSGQGNMTHVALAYTGLTSQVSPKGVDSTITTASGVKFPP